MLPVSYPVLREDSPEPSTQPGKEGMEGKHTYPLFIHPTICPFIQLCPAGKPFPPKLSLLYSRTLCT
jgi:hypothetical protein